MIHDGLYGYGTRLDTSVSMAEMENALLPAPRLVGGRLWRIDRSMGKCLGLERLWPPCPQPTCRHRGAAVPIALC